MPRPYPLELRERAVRASDEHGLIWAAVMFDVGTATLKRWRRMGRETGSLQHRPMGGARGTVATAERLEKAVDEKPDRLLRELVTWFLDHLRVVLSESGLCRALQRAGFARRKKVVQAVERNAPHVVEARRAFLAEIAGCDPERLVFLDESGCQRGMIRRIAWRRAGSAVIGKSTRNRGTVTTILSALSVRGIVATMFGEGATTGEVFLAFLRDVLLPELTAGDVVVMDNLGAHHAGEVVDILHAAKIRVIFLPPYSPELNPIEEAWSKLKTAVRSWAPQSLRELHAAIKAALLSITASDARGWFGHSGYLPTPQT